MPLYWLTQFELIQWDVSLMQLLCLGLLGLWLYAIWPARELRHLQSDQGLRWRLFITLLVINGLWIVNASVYSGLHLHFLGLVSCMLLLGWRLATLALLLPCAFFSVFVLKQPGAFAAFSLFAMAIPLFLCFLVYSRSYHGLPKHIFVFIFVGGFINGGLSTVFHQLSWATWLRYTAGYSWDGLVDNYLMLIPLLAFPEALLNGMAVTLLVVYRPQWLFDYSDRSYLWFK
ncbi:MAG: energy-coupling factor ABC transporter permease [Shewanella sp.]